LGRNGTTHGLVGEEEGNGGNEDGLVKHVDWLVFVVVTKDVVLRLI
jgi:hypothetical protein